jgi:tRNA(Ile)-lysidine synthase
VSAAEESSPVSPAEAKALFAPFVHAAAVVLAISGGPDSTALLLLAARWRRALRKGPKLLAVTIDHGLRAQSAAEARQVKRLAARLGIAHRTLRWRGGKPATAVQEAAREARYRLLARVARAARADCIVTAHTLDDQAETVLIRMARGSGLSGLAGMARVSPLPVGRASGIMLARPLLDIPKARLMATLERARIGFAEDPTNRDPRFTRARLREMMPMLAREGLDARRLGLLVRRIRRADAAIATAVDAAAGTLAPGRWPDRGAVVFSTERFAALPEEVALRLLGRAIAHVGRRPVRLGRLESLFAALASSWARRGSLRLRRTLGEALVTLTAHRITIERAPPRARNRVRSGSTTDEMRVSRASKAQ